MAAAYVRAMLPAMMDAMQIFTDGSFDAASRSGGWAFVVMEGDRQIHVAYGATTGSSNNTFEVLSVVNALSWLAKEAAVMPVVVQPVILWTDSAHVFEGYSRWRFIWRGNGWKRVRANAHERRRAIPDMKLWQDLDDLLEGNTKVRIQMCKGHTGISGNEDADSAAKAALTQFLARPR
jgi:ribonuclease HI